MSFPVRVMTPSTPPDWHLRAFFVCKDGISHNEIEDAKPEHLAAGCNVLLHAMLAKAQCI
jgi:acetylornithine deacetylase/succinyl-diaminopimelate desuccinylase-like protein